MPGSNDPDEIVVAPGGTIYVAPVGTALPVEEDDALNAAFVELGYVSDDGVQFRDGTTKEKIPVWQSFYPARTLVTEKETQLEFALRQWNRDTVKLAFGGGEVSIVTSGHFRYTPPGPDDAPDERALVVGWSDGDRDYRIVVPKVTVADPVETQLVRTKAADLPLTLDVLGTEDADPWYLLTNDTAFSPS